MRLFTFLPSTLPVALAVLFTFSPVLSAQTSYTWDGGGGDNNWSTTNNWTPAGAPVSGNSVTFGDAGADGGGSNLVTSVMDAAMPGVAALRFENGSGLTHHLDLDGQTLGVTDLLGVGSNTFGQTCEATLSNGALLLGNAGDRIPNVRIGFRNAMGADIDGRLTLSVSNFSAYAGNFDVGRIDGSDQDGVRGTLDLRACNGATIDATRIRVGSVNGNNIGSQSCAGVLRLPLSGTTDIRTPNFWVGDSNPHGNTAPLSKVEFGSNTVVHVDNLAIARRKMRAIAEFGTGGGVLTIEGHTQPGADLHIGYNNVGTGTTSDGQLLAGGGTLNATLGELVLGLHGSGNGGGRGTLVMDAGAVRADTVAMALTDVSGNSTSDGKTSGTLEMNGGTFTVAGGVSDGNGTSTILVDEGALVVSNGFSVDVLRVGHNVGTGTVHAAGAVRVGTGNQTVSVALRDSGSASAYGSVDFSDASSVTINAAELRLGAVTGGPGGYQCTGVVRLSETGTNRLSLNTLRVGDSTRSGNTADTCEIRFGSGTNVVAVNEINIGQRKSIGVATVSANGIVVVSSRGGGAANLYVGRNNVNTASDCEGMLDTTNGTLVAQFDQVVLGLHDTGNGSGTGLFAMGPGRVSANRVVLSNPSAGGTSANPLNTRGTLRMVDGVFDVSGDVVDLGGTSRLDVEGGQLTVRGDLVVDTVNLGGGPATNGTLTLDSAGASQTWLVDSFDQRAGAALKVSAGPSSTLLVVKDAVFEFGALLDVGVAHGGGPNTNEAEATHWIGGSNVWDDTTHAHWSDETPAEHVMVESNDAFTVLVATNSLADSGLSAASSNWAVNVVTAGATGRVDVTWLGSPLEFGQRWAVIDAASAVAVRPGGLLLGDTSGSGAGASGLTVYDGRLDVAGGITGDGGNGMVRMHGGDVRVDGGLAVPLAVYGGRLDVSGAVTNGGWIPIEGGEVTVEGDFVAGTFRLGYQGRTGTLLVTNGAVRIGDAGAPQVVDIGRRDGNPGSSTTAAADFGGAGGVTISASELRIGTADQSNGSVMGGTLTLSAAGTNRVNAATVMLGHSPQEGGGQWPGGPTNALHFGGGENVVSADVFYVSWRKVVGHMDIVPGGSLSMCGLNQAGTKLRIGFNDTSTGTTTDGVLDLSGATFDAALDELLVARHNRSSGRGRGTFIMDDGAVTVANNVELARVSVGGTSSNPKGTLAAVTLNGGSFDVGGQIVGGGGTSRLTLDGADVTAGSVRDVEDLTLSAGSLTTPLFTNGVGTATFAFSGGALAAETIGLGTNLVQTGGVLTPGGEGLGYTRIAGGCELRSGSWQLDVAGDTNDFVSVEGVLTLGPGSTLDTGNLSLSPPATNVYVVAQYDTLNGTFADVNGLPAGVEVAYGYGPAANQIAFVERGTLLIVR